MNRDEKQAPNDDNQATTKYGGNEQNADIENETKRERQKTH